MNTPVHEAQEPRFDPHHNVSSEEDLTYVGGDGSINTDRNGLHLNITNESQQYFRPHPSLSQTREQESRLDDDLAMLQAEREASKNQNELAPATSLARSRSRRTEPVDEFDVNTNPVHEKTSVYRPPEHPSTNFAKVFKKIHDSSFLVRYFMYIIPIAALLLVPLLLGALLFKSAHVGGVELLWFSVWLEIIWLTLWAGRVSLSSSWHYHRFYLRYTFFVIRADLDRLLQK